MLVSALTSIKNIVHFAEKYPELGREPVSVEPYVSAEYFEREREAVFKRVWLNVAREEDLPSPGNYLVKDIDVLKTSIIVIRGNDGNIRAFHNICRHRGNKLIYKEGQGSTRAIACRFHGWVYGNGGELVDVPASELYYDMDKSCHSLIPLACDVWEGFVFINYDQEPKESLRSYLGELGERYTGYPFANMPRVASYSTLLKANWKTAADAFQEAIHVPFIHGITMGDAFTNADNPHCTIRWAELYERHRTGSVYGAPQMERTLFPTEQAAFSQFGAFTQGADTGANLPGVNPANLDNWAFDLNVIFPHFFLDPGNSQYFTMHFWPVDVTTTRWEFKLYMLPAHNAAEKVAQKYTDVVMRDAALEDLSTVEKTQEMLGSGVIHSLPLSDQEILVRHNLHVVERELANA